MADSGWFQVQTAAAKSLQLCLTLCNPTDGSPPGSQVPGILQARTLEWVAISFSNAWKWKVKVQVLSHVRLFVTWTAAYQAPPSMGFSRQEYWSGVPLPAMHIFREPLVPSDPQVLYGVWLTEVNLPFLELNESSPKTYVFVSSFHDPHRPPNVFICYLPQVWMVELHKSIARRLQTPMQITESLERGLEIGMNNISLVQLWSVMS